MWWSKRTGVFRRRLVAGVVCAGLFAAAQTTSLGAVERADDHPLVGHPAPDFAVTDTRGNLWELSELRGRVVVLQFWSTTCHSCVHGLEIADGLARRYSDDDVVFLAPCVSNDAEVEEFLAEHDVLVPVIGARLRMAHAFSVRRIPACVVVDPRGVVTHAILGATSSTEARIAQAVDACLDTGTGERER
ncbi:MAG: peroxiredoxin family protein [Spirochaetota bacterium]